MRFTKHLDIVLKKMCKMVKCDFDTFEFKDDWYWKYEWTQNEEEKFIKWMVGYLQKSRVARHEIGILLNSKASIERGVRMFVFNYGWKNKVKTGKIKLSELGRLK